MKLMSINKKEILNGSILIVAGLWIWRTTLSFPKLEEGYPGPALFPQMISIGFILCGLILFFMREEAEQESASVGDRYGVVRLLSGVVLVALYPILRAYLGSMPALGLICFSLALLLRVEVWKGALAALGTVLFIYLTFVQLLGVSL